MANTLLALSARQLLKNVVAKQTVQTASMSHNVAGSFTRRLIGKREVVGYGFNGEPSYVDRNDFPFPAIRWREPNADILVSTVKLLLQETVLLYFGFRPSVKKKRVIGQNSLSRRKKPFTALHSDKLSLNSKLQRVNGNMF